jgi:hypothetical protein
MHPQKVLATSRDGKQWTNRKSGTTVDLLSVTWNGARFASVSKGVILTSADGTTWKDLTVATSPDSEPAPLNGGTKHSQQGFWR